MTEQSDLMKSARNWHTTLAGIVAGVGSYLSTIGPTLPTNLAEWGSFLFGLVLVVWGVLQKDGSTGSSPGATR